MMKLKLNQLAVTAIAVCVASYSGNALSQSGAVLEEILVTAQKRTQSLQDVPLAVTAMDGEKLTEANINTLAALSTYVPNFHQTRSGISNVILIRGTGSGPNNGFEQSVGMFRDGIYMGRSRQTIMPLYDLARVEVIKGPQTILFGKNTIAGAVSIITSAPTEEFEGYISGSVGSFDSYQTEAVVSGPLSDDVSGRIALRHDHTDGWLDNVFFDRTVPETDNYAGRARLDWNLTEDTSVQLITEYTKRDAIGSDTELVAANVVNTVNGAVPSQLAGVESRFNYESNIGNTSPLNEGPTETTAKVFNNVVRLDTSIGEHILTSITGFSGLSYDAVAELDSSPANIIGAFDSVEEYDQWSQEFQFKSPLGQTFEYITGIYLQTAKFVNETDVGIVLTSVSSAATTAMDGIRLSRLEQNTDTFSAFASGTWNVTDNLRIKGGLRYTYESKELEKSMAVNNLYTNDPLSELLIDLVWEPQVDTSSYAVKLDKSENDTSPMLIVEYDIDEDIMTYASVIKGFKAGGYDSGHTNGTRLDLLEFDPEEALAFELGAKMTLLDGRANLNIAAFQNSFEDLQVSIFNGATSFIVTNAAESTSRGVELDGRYLVNKNFMLSGSVAWLDNTYDDFIGAPCNVPQAAQNAQSNIDNGATGAAIFEGCVNDLGGKNLVFSPKWAASVSADYTFNLSESFDLTTTLDLNYRDDHYLATDLDPSSLQEAQTKVNARIALVSTDGKWWVALQGKNLTDEKTLSSGGDLPFGTGNTADNYALTGQLDYVGAHTGVVQPPRSYTVDFRYNF